MDLWEPLSALSIFPIFAYECYKQLKGAIEDKSKCWFNNHISNKSSLYEKFDYENWGVKSWNV